jgi:hypothetical protein
MKGYEEVEGDFAARGKRIKENYNYKIHQTWPILDPPKIFRGPYGKLFNCIAIISMILLKKNV